MIFHIYVLNNSVLITRKPFTPGISLVLYLANSPLSMLSNSDMDGGYSFPGNSVP